jgi:hypothetical protein
VLRLITPKYVARLRRQIDIEIRGTARSQPTTSRIFVETKHQDDLSRYESQAHQAQTKAGE